MISTRFRTKIRGAIADPQLQAALDANAERRGMGRAAAFASLPDWEARRQRAHAVRADVIRRLPEVLAQFISNANRHGMKVHRAADATEALNLVTAIAEGTGQRQGGEHAKRALLFAKSKSMVSEEIELNAGLERLGHRVVETDLGEYIVQLRGERPAHIITPAVHLLRAQVGSLFEDKLKIPYSEDIAVLTAAARRALREVFLAADVGISGVNFGVAETGGICIVTNEGNGRMVTTLPAVHIALMGMERLVPGLDDLALMLSLLPRSATGQKLSVYTQLIHGPRGNAEVDGAIERHLVIVDNGRTRLWDSGLQEALYCIRCGACLNACPVFREIGGHAYVDREGAPAPYPGPIGSIVSPGLKGLSMFGHLAQASSLCGACKDACPVDIDLPSMLTGVRAGVPEHSIPNVGVALSAPVRFALKAFTWIARRPAVFGAAQRTAAIAAELVSPGSDLLRMPAFTRWGASKDLVRPARRPFRQRWKDRSPRTAESHASAAGAAPMKVRREEIRAAVGAKGATERTPVRLAAEMEALGAHVEVVHALDASERILELLRGRGIRQLACWSKVDGVDLEALRLSGIELVGTPEPEVKAGLTGCSCAIAETGTIVITSGPGRPLTASLLPELHIAVVRESNIVADLESAMVRPEVFEAATSVLITGPSRTADIEMTLTIGVHGPRDLHVLIVQ